MEAGRRSTGWRAVQVIAMAVFALNAVGLAAAVVLLALDGRVGALVGTAIGGLVGLVFWRWIALGAGVRADRPPPDPADPESPRMGPWGYVGAALIVLMVVGFAVILVLATIEGRRQDAAVAQVRDDAVELAEQDQVTVAQVQEAIAERLVDLDGSGPDPLAALLPVEGADVLDADVEDGEALVLLRPDRGGPPCVILRIAPDGSIDSLKTERCS